MLPILDSLDDVCVRSGPTSGRSAQRLELCEQIGLADAALAAAPSPLGQLFLQRFARLDAEERRRVVEAATGLANLLSREASFQS